MSLNAIPPALPLPYILALLNYTGVLRKKYLTGKEKGHLSLVKSYFTRKT